MEKPTFQLNETVVAMGHMGQGRKSIGSFSGRRYLNMETSVVGLVRSQYTERGFELPSEIV